MKGKLKKFGYFIPYYCKAILGDKRPVMAGMKITHKCNLSCLHCPFWKKDRRSLTYRTICLSMEELYQDGVRILIFEGGEPLMWKDQNYTIRDIINKAKELFFTAGITTNGTLPIPAGPDIVWVSIDGLKKTHEKIRGKNFDRIMRNIKNSPHPRIYAHITINMLNWKEIPDLVEFLSGKVKGITLQFHYPYEEDEKELFLPFEKRSQVLDRLIRMKKQGYPLLDSYACLKALKKNTWRCRPWMIASVDADGKITRGCYLTNRAEISCPDCGFAAHTELSLAYNGVIESIITGSRILL